MIPNIPPKLFINKFNHVYFIIIQQIVKLRGKLFLVFMKNIHHSSFSASGVRANRFQFPFLGHTEHLPVLLKEPGVVRIIQRQFLRHEIFPPVISIPDLVHFGLIAAVCPTALVQKSGGCICLPIPVQASQTLLIGDLPRLHRSIQGRKKLCFPFLLHCVII